MHWSAARLSGSLSVFRCTQANAIDYFNQISVFLAEDYVHLIDIYEGRKIYSNRVPVILEAELTKTEFVKESPSYAHDFRWSQRSVTAWTEEANRIRLGGFDQVIVLSEDAINALFRARWSNAPGTRASPLRVWSQKGFEANFGLMKIHLMSDNRAIIFVNIRKATMSLDNRSARKSYHLIGGIF